MEKGQNGTVDEPVVKLYSGGGMPLIHSSPGRLGREAGWINTCEVSGCVTK